jgi:hypothetical protein
MFVAVSDPRPLFLRPGRYGVCLGGAIYCLRFCDLSIIDICWRRSSWELMKFVFPAAYVVNGARLRSSGMVCVCVCGVTAGVARMSA